MNDRKDGREMKKRLIAALLSCFMILSLLPVTAMAEEETTEPGNTLTVRVADQLAYLKTNLYNSFEDDDKPNRWTVEEATNAASSENDGLLQQDLSDLEANYYVKIDESYTTEDSIWSVTLDGDQYRSDGKFDLNIGNGHYIQDVAYKVKEDGLYVATVLLALSQKIVIDSGESQPTERTIVIEDDLSVCSDITYGTNGNQGTSLQKTVSENGETEYTVMLPCVDRLGMLLWFQPNVEGLSTEDLAITRQDTQYAGDNGRVRAKYELTPLDYATKDWQFSEKSTSETSVALGLDYPSWGVDLTGEENQAKWNGARLDYSVYIVGKCRFKATLNFKTASVTPVAQVGDTYYYSLTDAMKAFQSSSQPVTLLRDVTLHEPLNITENMAIDLNGHMLKGDGVSAIHIENGLLILENTGDTEDLYTIIRTDEDVSAGIVTSTAPDKPVIEIGGDQ
jgi:hypothetical protein